MSERSADARATLERHFLEALAGEGEPERRVETLVMPAAEFTLAAMESSGKRPLVVGLSGPQGCGKSTLAAQIVEAMVSLSRRAVAISIDDFYLPHEAQREVAARHPGSRIMEHRGHPGTHDVALGARILDRLSEARAGEVVEVPRYDKGAHEGRGDRHPREAWSRVEGPLDLVVLEGWMLGFTPVAADALDTEGLAPANAALADYAAWHRRLGALLSLDVPELEHIVAFRVEAERKRREAGEAGLSDAEAEDYIRRFLPAYRTWVPGLRAAPPVEGPRMHLTLGPDRLPIV